MNGSDQRFAFVQTGKPPNRHTCRKIRCCRCPASELINDNTSGGMPVSLVAEKFRQKGWHVAARANGDQCPKCAKGKASRRAAYCKIAGAPRAQPKQQEMPVSDAAVEPPSQPKADPPREPTIADRRKIMDTLDATYDVDAGRYRKSYTDQSVAEQLKVPRAWVSELREQLYGPELNEATAAREAAVEQMEKRLRAVEEEALARMTKTAEEVAAIRTALRALSR